MPGVDPPFHAEDRQRHGGNTKIQVPSFDGVSKTLKKYRRDVAIWEVGTEIDEKKRGATLLAALSGKAEEATEELDPTTIATEDGVAKLLEYLAKKFPELEVLAPTLAVLRK